MASRSEKLGTIEGVRPVVEAIRAGRRRVLEVTLPPSGGGPGMDELAGLLREAGIPSRPGRAGDPVVARAEAFPEETFEELLMEEGPRFLVGIDRVTDVGNLGSIARSAEASGVTGLVLEHRRAAPIGAGAMRASAGAIEHLRVGRTPNLRKALELAAAEGLSVLVAEPGGHPIEKISPELLSGELVWVFGSEERGTRAVIRALATEVVGIPLGGAVASLNVAAAAAFLLLRTAEFRRADPV